MIFVVFPRWSGLLGECRDGSILLRLWWLPVLWPCWKKGHDGERFERVTGEWAVNIGCQLWLETRKQRIKKVAFAKVVVIQRCFMKYFLLTILKQAVCFCYTLEVKSLAGKLRWIKRKMTLAILESTEVVGCPGVHHVGGIVTLISYIYISYISTNDINPKNNYEIAIGRIEAITIVNIVS